MTDTQCTCISTIGIGRQININRSTKCLVICTLLLNRNLHVRYNSHHAVCAEPHLGETVPELFLFHTTPTKEFIAKTMLQLFSLSQASKVCFRLRYFFSFRPRLKQLTIHARSGQFSTRVPTCLA